MGPDSNWNTPIKLAIIKRAHHVLCKHLNIDVSKLETDGDPIDHFKSGSPLKNNYDAAFNDSDNEDFPNIPGGTVIGEVPPILIAPFPSGGTPTANYWASRPGVEAPYRWVVTFDRKMVDAARPDAVAGATKWMLLPPFESNQTASDPSYTFRADKRFRQTFKSVSEFEVLIDLLADNLDDYQDEINDSIWYYTYPGDQAEPAEVDLKFLAKLVRDAGDIITEFLFLMIGHFHQVLPSDLLITQYMTFG